MLDYDGTLAPFRARRDEALPYPGVREAVDRISAQGRTRVVVVSGRRAKEVAGLLALEHAVEVWGSHGFERMTPAGAVEGVGISEDLAFVLAAAARDARKAGFDESVEEKFGCVALHWRGLPDEAKRRIERWALRHWGKLASFGDLVLRRFDGGIELLARGRNKGCVVEEILQRSGAGVPAAYLGDDSTDEDAFAAIKGKGLAVLVRSEFRETKADIWIKPPKELIDFLWRWFVSLEVEG